jgi:hypothetical protein
LSAQIDVEESATAFFNLAIFNHKATAFTIHPDLCATPGRSGGWHWLTSHLSLEKSERINSGTNSIDANSSIAIDIDAGKRRIGTSRRKLDDRRKLESVRKVK